jgi:hypothetical protein
VDNGAGASDIRNDCNIRVDRFGKIVAAGIKSNDRCRDACDECMGRYDANLLTRFQPKPTKTLMRAVPFPTGKLLLRYKQH